jgi:glycosyltransferase involved in cell wall biosynthesis
MTGFNMAKPRVSVIMSVYNGAKYLRPAIDSILGQTFKDFEFVIINDGSSDSSEKIIESYNDGRIRLVSRRNKGLTASLNEGLGLAIGEFIARMDSDDISSPDRLEKEVAFLDAHPDVGLVGSNYTHIDDKGKKTGLKSNVFTSPADLKACLVICNQYGHGSVMLRASALAKTPGYKGYNPTVGHVEDYDLWVRMSRVVGVANIEESLYLWRKLPGSISNSALDSQIDLTFKVRDQAFEYFLKHRSSYRLFGFHPSGHNYRVRKSIMYRDFAYLAKQNGRSLLAIKFCLAAALYQPLLKRNYKYLIGSIYSPLASRMRFEFL